MADMNMAEGRNRANSVNEEEYNIAERKLGKY
jgi:hypothetical protein